MRKMLLTCAAVLGVAATATAQTTAPVQTTAPSNDIRPGHVPGVGDSYPASNRASNIVPGDTHSVIAPRLPAPSGGANASISQFLTDAQNSLTHGKTGQAQEALERAETAMLQRSVPADQAETPDQAPDVKLVAQARDDLARRDVNSAKQAISAAMTAAPQQQ